MKLHGIPKSLATIAPALLLCGFAAAQAPGPEKPPAQSPEEVVSALYNLVSARPGETPDWDKVRACFIPEALIMLRTSRTETKVFSLDGFIQDFVDFYGKPFRRGTRSVVPKEAGFTEKVVRMKAFEFRDMAHVLVLYEAHITGEPAPPQHGIDSWLLGRRGGRWVILAITNDIVSEDHPVPPELAGDR